MHIYVYIIFINNFETYNTWRYDVELHYVKLKPDKCDI